MLTLVPVPLALAAAEGGGGGILSVESTLVWGTLVVFTLFACFMVYFLTRFGIGSTTRREMLLKLHLPSDVDYHTAFGEVFYRALREHALLSVESLQDGKVTELVYSLEFKPGVDEPAFLAELRGITRGGKVALLTGQESIDV